MLTFYSDGALRENILRKKLKFSKLKLPDLVAQTVKSRSVKVSFPKALLSEISQFISILGIM